MPLRRPARHVYRQLMIRRCCRPREIRSDAKTNRWTLMTNPLMMWCRHERRWPRRRVPHRTRPLVHQYPATYTAGRSICFWRDDAHGVASPPPASAAMNDEHSIVVVYSIDRTAPDTEVPIATTSSRAWREGHCSNLDESRINVDLTWDGGADVLGAGSADRNASAGTRLVPVRCSSGTSLVRAAATMWVGRLCATQRSTGRRPTLAVRCWPALQPCGEYEQVEFVIEA